MTVAARQTWTLTDFLAWEQQQELRHEFDGFQPVAMTGGTLAHATIQSNLAISIGSRLRGKPCRFVGGDIKVLTTTTSRYPDGLVIWLLEPNDSTVADDPIVIFEILSRSTASTDHINKNQEYKSLPSVHRYVMLEQELIGATVFFWMDDKWIGHVLADGDTLDLPEIGTRLPLAELYEGLDFSAVDDPPPV